MENIQVQKKHQIAGNWDSRESNLVDCFDELDSILVTSNYAGIMVDSECRFTVYTRDDNICLLYTSPSPRDRQKSRMPSSA